MKTKSGDSHSGGGIIGDIHMGGSIGDIHMPYLGHGHMGIFGHTYVPAFFGHMHSPGVVGQIPTGG